MISSARDVTVGGVHVHVTGQRPTTPEGDPAPEPLPEPRAPVAPVAPSLPSLPSAPSGLVVWRFPGSLDSLDSLVPGISPVSPKLELDTVTRRRESRAVPDVQLAVGGRHIARPRITSVKVIGSSAYVGTDPAISIPAPSAPASPVSPLRALAFGPRRHRARALGRENGTVPDVEASVGEVHHARPHRLHQTAGEVAVKWRRRLG